MVLTKLDGELKFKLPSCVLELELTNGNPDLHQDEVCQQVADCINLNTQIRRLKMISFAF